MFTSRLLDSRNLFSSSFSTNFVFLVLDRMLQDLILRTWLCGTGFITRPGWLFHFSLTKMVGWNFFEPVMYWIPKGKSEGQALEYVYMIHRVGRLHLWHPFLFACVVRRMAPYIVEPVSENMMLRMGSVVWRRKVLLKKERKPSEKDLIYMRVRLSFVSFCIFQGETII